MQPRQSLICCLVNVQVDILAVCIEAASSHAVSKWLVETQRSPTTDTIDMLVIRPDLQAVVCHIDISVDICHGVLEVGAVDGGLPQLGTAFHNWLALLSRYPTHQHHINSIVTTKKLFSS